jgi:hypothetical protein
MATAMKKVINKSDTAIWITSKLAASRATNHEPPGDNARYKHHYSDDPADHIEFLTIEEMFQMTTTVRVRAVPAGFKAFANITVPRPARRQLRNLPALPGATLIYVNRTLYEETGLRDIAADVEIDVALVHRPIAARAAAGSTSLAASGSTSASSGSS